MTPHQEHLPVSSPNPAHVVGNVVRAGGPGVPATPAALNPMALLRGLRRRWLLATCLGLIFAAGAGFGILKSAPPPMYTANSIFKILNKQPTLIAGNLGEGDAKGYKKSQMAMMNSRLVINDALNRPEVAKLQVVQNRTDPVEWLTKLVKVANPGSAEFVTLTVDNTSPDLAKTLVKAVTDSYMELVVNAEDSARLKRTERLRTASETLRKKLEEKHKVIRSSAANAGGKDQDVLSVRQKMAVEANAKAASELRSLNAKIKKDEITLQLFRDRMKAAESVEIPPELIEEALQKDASIRAILQRDRELEKTLDAKKRIIRNPKSDPVSRDISKAIAENQQELIKLVKQLKPIIARELREAQVGKKRVDIELLVQEMEFDRLIQQSLEADVKQGEESTKREVESSIDLAAHTVDQDILAAKYKQYQAEIEKLDIEGSIPSRVELLGEVYITNPAPDQKTVPMAGIAAFGVFAFILLGVSFLETRTRRIETVDEVVKGLGINLVGALPMLPERRRALPDGSPHPRDQYWSNLLIESVDALRTMLLHAVRSGANRVVMITSARDGEGKTTLSGHLATSLARAGHRTLLVDGDLRKPAAHRAFDVALSPGLAEVLRDEIDLESAVAPTPINDLWMIPAGHCDSLALRALAQDSLGDLFNRLRGQFDTIIIDSPPVLPVADPLLLGKHADAVIVSILREVSRAPEVQAAYERMIAMELRILGAVVTGTSVGAYNSKYHYGNLHGR